MSLIQVWEGLDKYRSQGHPIKICREEPSVILNSSDQKKILLPIAPDFLNDFILVVSGWGGPVL